MARWQGRMQWWAASGLALLISVPAFGQIVPGTGSKVRGFGDDFEDPKWGYVQNGRKSSQEQDGRIRSPKGRSRNGKWIESVKRGHPDQVTRVDTPPGGLPGSKGALLLRSRDTGIPGRPRGVMAQDDFVANDYPTSVASSPSFVVRVYLQPFDEWEDRQGSTFGFRAGCRTTISDTERKEKKGLFGRTFDFITIDEEEAYWPGMFIQFLSSHDGSRAKDQAVLVCRAGRTGKEFQGMTMSPGWWTLGLSFTPEGAVHYYASEGVDPLTPADRIGSSFPYNFRCERVTTMFFNICSADDGKTWSTPWIIDDPEMYVGSGRGGIFMEARESRSSSSGRRGGGFLGKLFR